MKQQKEEDMGHNLGGEGNETFRMNDSLRLTEDLISHFQLIFSVWSFLLHVFIGFFLFKLIIFRFVFFVIDGSVSWHGKSWFLGL